MSKCWVLAMVALVTLVGVGAAEDYAQVMLKKADMQVVVRVSYDVRPWEEKTFATYFLDKDDNYMTVGQVIEKAGDRGKITWKSAKVSDAVRVYEVRIKTFTDKNIVMTFRVNVESGKIVMDDLEIDNTVGETMHGLTSLSIMMLAVYAKI